VRHLAAWCFLILLARSPAFGCFCDPLGPPPMCQQLRPYKGSALFLGVVTDIQYRKVSFGNALVREQLVSFSIEQVFAGIQGKTVTLTSFSDAGMCGYPFRKGLSYLVDATYQSYDASGGAPQLSVNSCGMTAPAAYAADSIHFLRTIRRNPHGGVVFGTIKQYVKGSTFVSLNNKAIGGTSVLLDAAPNALLNAENREAVVDSTGWYEFVGLPEGAYTVTAQVPSEFHGVLQHTVELQRDGCAQVDVRVHATKEQ
jgi:hypothetical protein